MPDEINERGNTVVRTHDPESNRYNLDFGCCSPDKGWLQYDTNQDASYFGVWVNPKRLYIVTFSEGDGTLVKCPTVESYNAEIESMNAFYGEGFIAKAIDAEGITVYRQDRSAFFIKPKPQEPVPCPTC